MTREKIYTPGQVLAASILGGPAAAVYTLTMNGAPQQAPAKVWPLIGIGWIAALCYILLIPFLPPLLSFVLLPPLYCALAYFVARKSNIAKKLRRLGVLTQAHGKLNIGLVIAGALTATLIIEYIWLMLLPNSPLG